MMHEDRMDRRHNTGGEAVSSPSVSGARNTQDACPVESNKRHKVASGQDGMGRLGISGDPEFDRWLLDLARAVQRNLSGTRDNRRDD